MKNINAKIKKYIDEYTALCPFSGAIAVRIDGQDVFKEYFGMASLEHSVPNSNKTRFKIASLTKQFTCTAIMILKERGLLNVNESIKRFFPDYPELDERITIYNLMTHTSGLFNNFSVVDPHLYLGRRLFTESEIFNVFKDMPLHFEPGEDWDYCFFGYYLLGVIIQRVSGKSYIEFLKDNIFEPLGMKNTGLDDYIEVVPHKAGGYYCTENRIICCETDTMSAFSAGALYSTVDDMLLWDKALYTEKILSKESLNEMFTPFRENYGYGWIIDQKHNNKRVRHSGGMNGFKHQFHRYLDDRVTILVLSNYGFTDSLEINESIANIVFHGECPSPSKPAESKIDLAIFDKYLGVYGELLSKYELKKVNEKLYVIEQDKWIMPVYPTSENSLYHTWVNCEYTLESRDDKLYFWGIEKVK